VNDILIWGKDTITVIKSLEKACVVTIVTRKNNTADRKAIAKFKIRNRIALKLETKGMRRRLSRIEEVKEAKALENMFKAIVQIYFPSQKCGLRALC
jgi:regulator of replication initiation timing